MYILNDEESAELEYWIDIAEKSCDKFIKDNQNFTVEQILTNIKGILISCEINLKHSMQILPAGELLDYEEKGYKIIGDYHESKNEYIAVNNFKKEVTLMTKKEAREYANNHIESIID